MLLRAVTVAALLAGLLITAANAKTQRDVEVSEQLGICPAPSPADAGTAICQLAQRQFRSDYVLAHDGDYSAQRNVAFCLSTGCSHSVRTDNVQACAWWMVLLQSDHPQTTALDRRDAEAACDSLSLLQHDSATKRASRIMTELKSR